MARRAGFSISGPAAARAQACSLARAYRAFDTSINPAGASRGIVRALSEELPPVPSLEMPFLCVTRLSFRDLRGPPSATGELEGVGGDVRGGPWAHPSNSRSIGGIDEESGAGKGPIPTFFELEE